MTTVTQSSTSGAGGTAPQLAIFGGPKAVTVSGRDRWCSVQLRDAIPIVKQIRWGFTTSPGSAFISFEQTFASLVNCQFGLAMNSGTAALHSALFAVGVGPGDEVILPSYTYHASASAVLCCGATPVFCDIDPGTLTADPSDIEARITDRTKAIMVVHVWGNPAKMDAIKELCQARHLALVEDCSHAHGASFQGQPVGSWGDVGCFSLQGAKAVSAGEGGIAVCSEAKYFDRMLALGQPVRVNKGLKAEQYDLGNINVGPKYRPHLFGVLLARSSLRRLPELNRLRRRNWQILCDELADCELLRPVETLPQSERGGFLEFKFVISPSQGDVSRDELLKSLEAEGVPASADRYGFLHDAAIFRCGGPITVDGLLSAAQKASPRISLPQTEMLRERIITLPAFVNVKPKYVQQCGQALAKVASHYSGGAG